LFSSTSMRPPGVALLRIVHAVQHTEPSERKK
jgi:hypothetical protein